MKIKEKVLAVMKGKVGQIFLPHEIVNLVLQKFPDTNRTSVLPADYCYNRINKGIKFDFLFIPLMLSPLYRFLFSPLFRRKLSPLDG